MKRLFWLIVALQLLFLVGEVATKEIAIARAPTVILKTAPIDPRSLFTGNYMTLGYDISTVSLSRTTLPASVRKRLTYGDVVYAKLAVVRPWAKLLDVTTRRPDRPEPGVVYLKGSFCDRFTPGQFGIEYGLDRYYIPENRTEEVAKLERWTAEQPVITVEVAITSSGQGMIKRVFVDGKPLGF